MNLLDCSIDLCSTDKPDLPPRLLGIGGSAAGVCCGVYSISSMRRRSFLIPLSDICPLGVNLSHVLRVHGRSFVGEYIALTVSPMTIVALESLRGIRLNDYLDSLRDWRSSSRSMLRV